MSGEQQRTSSTSTGADDKTHSKDFSALQKLFVVGIALSTMGGIWFLMSGQAATTFDVTLSPTTVAETITTNPTLESGLVGHWTFDGPDMDWSASSAEVEDRSGNGKHGNAENGMSAPSVTSGVIGQGLRFDGDNDAVRAGGAGDFDSFPMSVALWAIYDEAPSAQGGAKLIQKCHYSSDPWASWIIGGNPADDKIYITLYDVPTAPHAVLSNDSIVADRWYHIAATVDDIGFVNLYIDGVQQTDTAIISSMLDGDGPLDFANNCWDNNAFGGALDDARIYNRALPADEVKRLYELGATTRVSETITTNPQLETGLVGHWTFDGPDMDWSSTTAEVRDRSGQRNNGNADASMTSRLSSVPGVMGQGLRFDGTDDSVVVGQNALLNSDDVVTVSLWLNGNVPQGSSYYKLISKRTTGDGWMLQVIGTGPNVGFRLDTSAGANQQPGTITNVLDSEWHHIVGVFDTGTVRIYKDGNELYNTSYSHGTGFSNTENLVLGASSFQTSPFRGALDDVRIHNRALSAEEVKRLYDLGR